MLFKDSERGTYVLTKDSAITRSFLIDHRFKIYTHFNTERNELFFARKVILVEGASDKIMLTTLCENKWSIDIDKEGVSIIECGGKTGVLYFIGVCRLMGISDYFAMWDEDPAHPVTDEHSNLARALAHDRGCEIPGDLEAFLHERFPAYSFSDDRKVEDAYTWATGVETESVPPEFLKIREFILGKTETETTEIPITPIVTAEPEMTVQSAVNIENLPF